MSYRLIDSNAIAIKYPEVNEMPCVFADLPDGLNGQFIDAQPEPLQVARDIATIIENERDMRAILSQPEQQWIPCSERLPDTNRDVLLQFGNSMGVGFWEHNSWGINTGDDIYSEIGEREAQPIAWRELPEPWEGER